MERVFLRSSDGQPSFVAVGSTAIIETPQPCIDPVRHQDADVVQEKACLQRRLAVHGRCSASSGAVLETAWLVIYSIEIERWWLFTNYWGITGYCSY